MLAMMNTSGQPALASLENRALRERIMETSLNRGSHGGAFDNRAVIARIAKLRAERANLLGYTNHAAYSLEDPTANTTDAVNNMTGAHAPAAAANARTAEGDLQKMIDAETAGHRADKRRVGHECVSARRY